MASFNQCIDTAVEGGVLKKSDGDRLKREHRRHALAHANVSPATAAKQAVADLIEEIEAGARHKKRKAILALQAARRINADARSWRNAAGKGDLGAAFLDMLEHFGTANFSSVAGRQRAITGMAHAKMESLLHHFRRGAITGDKGRWNVADLGNVLREAFGEDTGDAAAKGFAKVWTETAEWLRQRFNAAGGAIGKLDNWGLPQHHDPRALRKAGLAAWKAAIAPKLDPARMRHPLTGKAMTAADLDEALDAVWKQVATEGWERRKPTQQRFGSGPLANQHAEHRFLVFKDPASWLDYQRDFGGGGDVFATMMAHVNMMAKDIAAMEVLGPNPSGTIEWMKQTIAKEGETIAAGGKGLLGGATAAKALDRANGAQKRLDEVWGSIRGELETPVSSRWANGFSAVRSLITASVLGQAAISSISDVGTAMIARKFAGLPSGNAFGEIVKGFGGGTRREAVASGLILDSAAHVFHAQARYVGTFSGPEWAGYIADRVLTWSGLTPWTQAAKHAFGLAFQVEAGRHLGKKLADMPAALQATMRRYGISDRQWEMLANVPLHQDHLLRPAEIAERVDASLAEKYLEMIQTETEYAVPNGSHRSRSLMLGKLQPGTLMGEIARSGAQFKSFGVVFGLLHGMRIHRQIVGGGGYKAAKGWAAGAPYAGSLLLSTTLFGAMALQLKATAAGRDPRDVTDPAFWSAAMLQGGGLGIYGDFMFANVNRYGASLGSTLGGPTLQRVSDFWNLTAGNVIQLASGEKTHFGRELVKFARGNIPGGNIWYLKLAFEREVLDQVQFLVDPEANKAFKRQQQFWRRNFSNEFYWAPGERLPSRAPNAAAIVGG